MAERVWTDEKVEKMARSLARRFLGLRDEDPIPADLQAGINFAVALHMDSAFKPDAPAAEATDSAAARAARTWGIA